MERLEANKPNLPHSEEITEPESDLPLSEIQKLPSANETKMPENLNVNKIDSPKDAQDE